MAKIAQQRAAAGQLAAAQRQIEELQGRVAELTALNEGLHRKVQSLEAGATRPARATALNRQRGGGTS